MSSIVELRTENRQNPINIDVRRPRFSWRVESPERNWFQTAYRIRVFSDTDPVWDSDWVTSSEMNQIEYSGCELLPWSTYRWTVCVKGTFDGTVSEELSSDSVSFETALLDQSDWKAGWLLETENEPYHLFRREFFEEGPVQKARLYVVGLGQAECVMNGHAVSDNLLEPGWTDYRKSCLFASYDITGLILQGENAVCIKTGNGMYRVPNTGRYVYHERIFGDRMVSAILRITDRKGRETVLTTDASWMMGPSPIQYCCIYGGEDFDGRIPFEETSLPGYQMNPGDWVPALVTKRPELVLRAAAIPPEKVMGRYQPLSVIKKTEGWLYDLGKNFSGRVRIRIRTDGRYSGHTIKLTPAELLTPDGLPDQRVTGRGYAWTYICNDREEQEFAPDFTYTGFRYVLVEGAIPAGEKPDLPVLEELTGEFIYPDMEETGSFSCSNVLFNQIHTIIRQAMLSNIKSYFTDCPHREKLPWLEETHLIGPAMLCSWDLELLYEKIELDMADSQRENGLVADICPEYVTGFDQWHKGFLDSPEWGSACVINPWHLYRKYHNRRLLETSYQTMKRYVDYLTSRTKYGILHHGLGDWLDIGPCPPFSQNTPIPVTATTLYYIDLSIMEKIAGILGKEADRESFAKQRAYVYQEYNDQFLDDQTGRYANGSQACQALSLIAGLVPDGIREKTLRQLRDEVVKRKYAITAGDVGHPYLVAALMKYHMNDLLNTMTNITETPGYGYQAVNGATTLTEDWDGPDPQKPHGSQNHLMLGSIDEWFFCGLGGIQSIRAEGAFDTAEICPHFADGIDFCSVSVGHPYGQIRTEWRRNECGISLQVRIPPNLKAVIRRESGEILQTAGSGSWEFLLTDSAE